MGSRAWSVLVAIAVIACGGSGGDDDDDDDDDDGVPSCTAPEGLAVSVVRPPDAVEDSWRYVLNGLSCWDEDHCVAVGGSGRILASVDGGDSWQEVDDGAAGYAAVDCSGPERCLAVGDGGHLSESRDGGQTWAVLDLASTPHLNDVACPTEARCIAVGDENVALEVAGDGAIESLRDVGAASSDLHTIRCIDAEQCFVLSGAQSRGTSVRRVTLDPLAPRIIAAESLATGLPFEGTDLTCPEPDRCMTVGIGDGADVASSFADPAAWEAIPVIPEEAPALSWLAALDCADTEVCVAADDAGRLYRTHDGGRCWYEVPGGGELGLYPETVRCPSATRCFVSCDGGAILRMD